MLRPSTERSHRPEQPLLWSALVLLLALLPVSACTPSSQSDGGDNSMQTDQDSGSDTGSTDSGIIAPPTCVTDPQTYVDFLNACTTASTVPSNQSRLPHQLPDGGLPPPQVYDHDGGLPPDVCLGMDAGHADAGTAADAGSADAGK